MVSLVNLASSSPLGPLILRTISAAPSTRAKCASSRAQRWPRHCQRNAKNLYMSAVKRKLSLAFFFYDRPYFRHLYAVSFPHEEGVWERFFIQVTMPC